MTALAPILAAGPHVARRRLRSAAAERSRAGDLDIDDVGRDAKMPWEADGRRWHTQDRVGRTRRAVQVGRPHSGTRGRPHPRTGRVQRHRLEHAQRRRNRRPEESRRLVPARHHRRDVAAEAQVPRRPQRVPPRRADRPAEPEDAQRNGRPARLRQRAAGPLQDLARPVAGGRDPRLLAGRNRHAQPSGPSWRPPSAASSS